MTGQPPNTLSQSPERGQGGRLPDSPATNGRLAGAAAMLTHGVASVSLHHWRSGLRSRHARSQRRTTPAPTKLSYSLAVKGFSPFSGANHALHLTGRSRSRFLCFPNVLGGSSPALGR